MTKVNEDWKLLNEYPLLVLPSLAKVLGLNAAIVVQQIHYWLTINEDSGNNFKDGYYWTFNSIKRWQEQFPFWSKKTIERALQKVERSGIVVTGCYNKLSFDRTKWYRINYDRLIEVCSLHHNGHQIQWNEKVHSWCQNDLMGETTQLDKMTSPIPETNLNRLTTETNLPLRERDYDGSGLLEKPSPSSSLKKKTPPPDELFGGVHDPTPVNEMSLTLCTPKGKAEANSLTNGQSVLPWEDRATLESDLSAPGSPSRGSNQQQIKAYLVSYGPASIKEISLGTGIYYDAVNNTLNNGKNRAFRHLKEKREWDAIPF